MHNLNDTFHAPRDLFLARSRRKVTLAKPVCNPPIVAFI